MFQKEDFYAVMKRIMARRNATAPTPVKEITNISLNVIEASLNEQLSILARVNRQRENSLRLSEPNNVVRRSHRDIEKVYGGQ